MAPGESLPRWTTTLPCTAHDPVGADHGTQSRSRRVALQSVEDRRASGTRAADGTRRQCRPAAPPGRGVLIRFEGFIGPGNEQYLRRKLEKPRHTRAGQGARRGLVIIEIESPGGRLDSSMAIAEMSARRLLGPYRGLSSLDNAYSGAAMAALGCDEIVMAPGAILGDVGAIYLDENRGFKYIPEKAP